MGELMVRKQVKRRTSLLMGISLALLLGAATAFLVMTLPQYTLEKITVATRLAKLMVQAEPPISADDRTVLAILAGIGVAGLGWVLIDSILFGRAGLSTIFRRRGDLYDDYDGDGGYRTTDPLDLVLPTVPLDAGASPGDPRRPLSARTDIGDPPPMPAPRSPFAPPLDGDAARPPAGAILPQVVMPVADPEPRRPGAAPILDLGEPRETTILDLTGRQPPLPDPAPADIPAPPRADGPVTPPLPPVAPISAWQPAPPRPMVPDAAFDPPGSPFPPMPNLAPEPAPAPPPTPAPIVADPIARDETPVDAVPPIVSWTLRPSAAPAEVPAPPAEPMKLPADPIVARAAPEPEPMPSEPMASPPPSAPADFTPDILDRAPIEDLLDRLESRIRQRRAVGAPTPTPPAPASEADGGAAVPAPRPEADDPLAGGASERRALPPGFASSRLVEFPPPAAMAVSPAVPPDEQASAPAMIEGDALLDQPLHIALDALRERIRR